MSNRLSFRLLGKAAMLLGLTWLAACEGDKSVSDPGTYFDSNAYTSATREATSNPVMTISPTAVTLSNVGARVTFQAIGGTSPYRWDVSDDTIGKVNATGGDEALYTALAVGDNSVIVFDGEGHSAIATISGSATTAAALTAAASPTSLATDGDKSILTASGGTTPYTWSVVDASLGHIVGTSTGSSVVYVRDHYGNNVATVTDADGSVVNVLIAQP